MVVKCPGDGALASANRCDQYYNIIKYFLRLVKVVRGDCTPAPNLPIDIIYLHSPFLGPEIYRTTYWICEDE